MASHVTYLLLGLGGGAAIAMLALGLVATYQASGVINLAHAALGVYTATAFNEFRGTGELVLPIFGAPHIELGGRPTLATAFVMSVAVAGAFSLIVAELVYRPLRRGSPLGRMVASLGVMLYLIEVCAKRFGPQGSTSLVLESVLPNGLVRFGNGIAIYEDRLWLAFLAVLVATGVTWMTRSTRFGLSTLAIAENERSALLLGLRPERIAAINWTLAGMLAGAGMILAAPITKLRPVDTSMLVVPAIAAALVARFASPLAAAAAALAIGMVQSEILNLQVSWDWLPQVDLQQGVPLVVILGVLAFRSGALPARGHLGAVALPATRIPSGAGRFTLAVTGVALLGMWFGGSGWRSALIASSIGCVTALSLVVATGFVGQISLATLAFSGISAFTLVKLSDRWGLGFPWAPLLAALAAAAAGVLIGLPAVRVRGLTLAMTTLAAALAIEALLFKSTWFTGGIEGTAVPPPRLPGIDLGIQARGDLYPRRAFGMMVVLVAGALVLLLVQFGRSASVQRWLAVRTNERAAASLGINVPAVRLVSFALSAFLAGLAGALTAYQQGTLSVQSFSAFGSIVAMALVYVAGIGTPLGALVAGVLATGGVLTHVLGSSSSDYQFAVNGVLLVAAAVLLPDGIVGRATRRSR